MGQIQTLDQKIEKAATVKDLFTIPEVKERFIANYKAVTNREDGENRLQQERFAYLQLIADKPEVAKASNFYHMSALIYAATTGLSFRDNKLYVQPNGKGGLKVTSSPAGKREMFEMMPTIKRVPEGVIVYMGDVFVHDKANERVEKHHSTEKSKEINQIDNIRAAYQRLIYKDGTIVDVVVYQDEIKKAMKKSRMQGPDSTWETWTGEMAKKTALNRAFRLFHKYPDNIVMFGPKVEDDEDVVDSQYTDIPDAPQEPQAPEPTPDNVNAETGEITEAEDWKPEPKKETKKSEPGKQRSFMED